MLTHTNKNRILFALHTRPWNLVTASCIVTEIDLARKTTTTKMNEKIKPNGKRQMLKNEETNEGKWNHIECCVFLRIRLYIIYWANLCLKKNKHELRRKKHVKKKQLNEEKNYVNELGNLLCARYVPLLNDYYIWVLIVFFSFFTMSLHLKTHDSIQTNQLESV